MPKSNTDQLAEIVTELVQSMNKMIAFQVVLIRLMTQILTDLNLDSCE